MKFTVILLLLAAHVSSAQVGIGTTSPSPNSVLDLTSPNKGLLLPRVIDTSSVSNPSAGLMVYDINSQSPAFHNGAVWNSLASANTVSTTNGDSITYTFFGPNSFVQGTFKVISMSYGGNNTGSASGTNMQDVFISKNRDANSINFFKVMIASTVTGGIEFKIYESGAASPYYSVKLSNWKVSSAMQSVGTGGEINEMLSFSFQNIGFKDWTTNSGFSYNLATNVIGPY